MTRVATVRILHRYLGFFLAGIMAVYAISGVILIYRNTDFLKRDYVEEKALATDLAPEQVGKELRIKNFTVDRTEGQVMYFAGGSYDAVTGQAVHTVKRLPFVLDKMAHLHKANTKSPLYYFNISFGVALLFFVVSAFWMFMPGSDILRKGLLFSAVGIVLTLLLLFV